MLKYLKKPIIWSSIFLLGLFSYNNLHHVMIVEQVNKAIKQVDPKQLACMATNIFYEAGKEDMIGQAAVARVVINRIHHRFASTVCGVVDQKIMVEKEDRYVTICQFSWKCEDDLRPLNKNSEEYKKAEKVAYQVLAYDSYKEVVPTNTLFFHSTSIDPQWPYKKVATIGNHIFYSKQKKKHEQSKK